MKCVQAISVLLVGLGAFLGFSACQFLAQSGAVLSGVAAPDPSLWVLQGEVFMAIENGQVIETEHGKLQIALRPYPPRRANNIDIYLEDAGGQPVAAQVTIKYEMEGMAHGYDPLRAEPQGGGHYLARLELPMKGLWQLKIDIERPGASQPASYLLRLRNDSGVGGLGGHTGH